MDKYDVLKKYFGYTSFRDGQEEMVDCLLSGRDALGIMPTGAGKSICYQVPAMMMKGITIVVSPLISLMKDQVNALTQQGVSSAFINGSLDDNQLATVFRNADMGKYKIIYVAPERLLTNRFLNLCRNIRVSMVAIDEAHCVSQWGHDFRPSYLDIKVFISSLYHRPVVGAFTATATNEVKEDVINILELREPEVIKTGFDRPNLYFSVIRPSNKNNRLIELLKERKGKCGIVYCSTRKKVESVCDFLNRNGYSATRYHAGLEDNERQKNQDDFVYDRSSVMVATNAFGMGIDKSNVSYVIHYNMPKNIESYYQEAGRAGRDGEEADCILMYERNDVHINQFFIDNMEPNPQLTDEQNEFIRKREELRLKHMMFYCTTSECLRKTILRYFGDVGEERCGKCSNCLSVYETVDVTVKTQKILSCIIRTGQNYRAKTITDVLLGNPSREIVVNGLHKQSTFGIMKDSNASEIKHIIEKLEEMGYIIFVGAGRPILRVTEMSYPVLRGNASVKIKKSKKVKAKAEKIDTEIINKELFEQLRVVRKYFAMRRGVPDYVIFSDASLADMCRKLPTTEDDFMNVSGVVKIKMEKYGDAFINVIKEFKEKSVNE